MAPMENQHFTFWEAVQQSNYEVVRTYLKNGQDPNDHNRDTGYRALHLAKTVKMVELLIHYRADVHLEDDSGHTPLTIAICFDRFDVVKTLLKHGAELNLENGAGQTPLGNANTVEMARMLLRYGADINGNKPYRSPLCSSTNNYPVCQFLLQQHNIDVNSTAPLCHAIEHDRLDVFNLLLNHPDTNINQL